MKDLWEIGAKGICFLFGHDWYRKDDNVTYRCSACGEERSRKP